MAKTKRSLALFLPDHPCDRARIPAVEITEGAAQPQVRVVILGAFREFESVMKYQPKKDRGRISIQTRTSSRGGEERRELLLENVLIGAVRYVV
jgi:hypothetical protein